MTQQAPNEPITLIGLDDARARGTQAISDRDDAGVASDPHLREIELQGAQAENAAADTRVAEVATAVGAYRRARTRRQQQDPILLRAAEAWVKSELEVQRTEAEVDEHRRRLPLLPFGSGVVFLVLLVIAAAEWILNRAAFEITGEDSLNVDVLAVAVGVGLVTGAHFLGVALRRVVDRLPGARPHPAALLVASVAGALGLAVFTINSLRQAFFLEEDLPVPGGALAWLQVFLIWVAVALSAAHANPLRENLERVRSDAGAARRSFDKVFAKWDDLFRTETEVHARTWAVVASAAADADTQLAHTERGRQAFAQGAKATLEVVTPEPNRIVASCIEWLDGHSLDLGTPAVIVEVEKLLARVGLPHPGPAPSSETSEADQADAPQADEGDPTEPGAVDLTAAEALRELEHQFDDVEAGR